MLKSSRFFFYSRILRSDISPVSSFICADFERIRINFLNLTTPSIELTTREAGQNLKALDLIVLFLHAWDNIHKNC
jgi:hypothetical protein